MPRTVTKQVFQFSELSNAAKEKAREWFRSAAIHDSWWDNTYEDAVQCAKIIGIDIAERNQKCFLVGPNPREWIDRSPAIFFSGFSSQGDGACFEGTYSYAKGAAKKIRQHAPKDTKLHRIADELQRLQRGENYKLTAEMKHRGHYSHSGCMSVGINDGRWREGDNWAETDAAVTRLMRDFADWIYKQLETEYEFQNADAQVDETITANEYEFEADGTRTRD